MCGNRARSIGQDGENTAISGRFDALIAIEEDGEPVMVAPRQDVSVSAESSTGFTGARANEDEALIPGPGEAIHIRKDKKSTCDHNLRMLSKHSAQI